MNLTSSIEGIEQQNSSEQSKVRSFIGLSVYIAVAVVYPHILCER
jgi:hypothetical protein